MPIEPNRRDDVAEALGEVWRTNASAGRILNRVEQIFERAIARELRAPDNPARLSLQRHILGPAGEGGGPGARGTSLAGGSCVHCATSGGERDRGSRS